METLYDIVIELGELEDAKGVQLEHIPMLSDSAALIDVLTPVIQAREPSRVH